MLQAQPLGKREGYLRTEGRHTEGVWAPGKRKRVMQPPRLRGGIWWTPRPTGTSLKRTELGGWGPVLKNWGLPSKRSSELGSSADGLIRIVRGSKDLNQWERIIKRGADDQRRKWKKKNKKVVQRYRRLAGRLGKRQAGKNPVKWSRIKKRANEAIADEENDQSGEEYADEAEHHEEEFANESAGTNLVSKML